jgi:CRP-like cAMP-binding protein
MSASTHELERALALEPLFHGFDAAHVRAVAALADEESFAAGSFLFREGETADRLYIPTVGTVALELRGGGASHLIETIGPHEVVGLSWLFPPARWRFDARASTLVRALRLDAPRLLAACEADRALGYAIHRRIARTIFERLDATRVRLMDLYGEPRAR